MLSNKTEAERGLSSVWFPKQWFRTLELGCQGAHRGTIAQCDSCWKHWPSHSWTDREKADREKRRKGLYWNEDVGHVKSLFRYKIVSNTPFGVLDFGYKKVVITKRKLLMHGTLKNWNLINTQQKKTCFLNLPLSGRKCPLFFFLEHETLVRQDRSPSLREP
jgi:hypothetical protein